MHSVETRAYLLFNVEGLCQTVRERVLDSATLDLVRGVSQTDFTIKKHVHIELLVPGRIPILLFLRLMLLWPSLHSKHHKRIGLASRIMSEREIASSNDWEV